MNTDIPDRLAPAQKRLEQAIENLPLSQQNSAVQAAVKALDHLVAMLTAPTPVPPSSPSPGAPVTTTCPKCNKSITITLS